MTKNILKIIIAAAIITGAFLMLNKADAAEGAKIASAFREYGLYKCKDLVTRDGRIGHDWALIADGRYTTDPDIVSFSGTTTRYTPETEELATVFFTCNFSVSARAIVSHEVSVK